MPNFSDRCRDKVSTSGAGEECDVLDFVYTGFVTLANAFPNHSGIEVRDVPYLIANAAGSWEVGYGTLSWDRLIFFRTRPTNNSEGEAIRLAFGTDETLEFTITLNVASMKTSGGWGRYAASAAGWAMP